MASVADPPNIQPNTTEDEELVTVTVRLPKKFKKLVRQAAVERDTNLSAFMAEAAITAARHTLNLKREGDLRRADDAHPAA